jgi:hypothetical protein
MRSIARAAAVLALAVSMPAAAAAAEQRIGFGYHYWQTVDEIDVAHLDQVDDAGYSIVFSYQYLVGLIRFEGDLEYFDDGFGGSTESAYAPQAYVLVGRFFYAGVGVGVTHSTGFADGDWSDPWFAGRVGLDVLLLPHIHLDVNANYRANAFSELAEDTGAFTLGASLRLGF